MGKTVQENKCKIVIVPTQENECNTVYEKDCNQLEEAEECKTVLEDVCDTPYTPPGPDDRVPPPNVDEYGAPKAPVLVDSYGNPIPPHRRFKRQSDVDTYGAPRFPPVVPPTRCSCSQAECIPGQNCILCPIGDSSCAPLPCACTEAECLPGGYCNLCPPGEAKCGAQPNCRQVPREVCRTVSKPVCRDVAKNVCIPVAKPVERLVTKEEGLPGYNKEGVYRCSKSNHEEGSQGNQGQTMY